VTALVPERPNKALSIIDYLGIKPKRDTFKIRGSSGMIYGHVKKPTGEVLSVRIRARGSLKQFTNFDPNELSIDERRTLEQNMYDEGLSQAEIANLLGVSQATVCLDLKRVKKGRK
jgi:hypothetical protein